MLRQFTYAILFAVLVLAKTAFAQTITATPNPCLIPEGGSNCTSTISWPISNAYDLWITVPASGYTSIVASGAVGSVTVPWIGENEGIFQLRDSQTGQIYSSLSVYGTRPSLNASPNPCTIPYGSGSCTSTLSWTPSTVYDLWIYIPSTGYTSPVSSGYAGSVSLPWIGQTVGIFQLRDWQTGQIYKSLSVYGINAPPPPSCSSVSSNAYTIYRGSSVTLTANCSGAPSGYQWTSQSGGPAISGNAATVGVGPFNSTGVFGYSVFAENSSGNSNTVSLSITVVDPVPACTSISPSATTITVGSYVTYSASCSGTISSYAWSASSGAPSVSSNSATATVGPFYTAGTYTYSVYAQNGSGSSNTVSAQITVLSAPTCSSVTSSTASVSIGSSVTLTANCAGNNLAYYWGASSGAPGIPNNAQATITVGPFNTIGTYSYSVFVANSGGTSTPVSLQIVVTRSCDANNPTQLSNCLALAANNVIDLVQIKQNIDCSSSPQSCMFSINGPIVSRTTAIEIFGANADNSVNNNITITRGRTVVSAGLVTPAPTTFRITNVGDPDSSATGPLIVFRNLQIVDPTGGVEPNIATTCGGVDGLNYNDDPVPFLAVHSSNIKLSSIVIKSCAPSLIQAQQVTNFRIEYSTFRGGRAYGIWGVPYKYGQLGDDAHTEQGVNKNFSVVGNDLRDVGANAIFIGGTDQLTISGNTLVGNHRDNPFLGCGTNGMTHCDGGQLAIESGVTNASIFNNIIGPQQTADLSKHTAGIELAPIQLDWTYCDPITSVCTQKTAQMSNISISGNRIYGQGSNAITFDQPQVNKPNYPKSVSISGNWLYSNNIHSTSSTFPTISILQLGSGQIDDTNIDGNYFAAPESNPSVVASFLNTPTTCSLSGGSSCAVIASWVSNYPIGALQILKAYSSSLLSTATSGSGLSVSGFSATGDALEIRACATCTRPNEILARRWIRPQ